MEQLSRRHTIVRHDEILNGLLRLPVKVLQFGTGILLRALPDYFIDKANKAGVFNGRVVMVKSTDRGNDVPEFIAQDNLYTHCIQGYSNGKLIEETLINGSIAELVIASKDWQKVLAYAASPQIEFIISNTTESGLQIDETDALDNLVPVSFPAKLLAVLFHRYNAHNGKEATGFIILPTELVPNNGVVLKELVLQLAVKFGCKKEFITWVKEKNTFCDTLVDRIVPGKMQTSAHQKKEAELGYEDRLMIMSEPYSLWVIENDSPEIKRKLSFGETDDSVIVAPDISWYVEQKLRLLNGTHTFITGLAILSGFATVKDAMANNAFGSFVKTLMKEEIIPCIAHTADQQQMAESFANSVIDRFRNPFLEHKWQSIALNYSSKMQLRNLPLLNYWKSNNIVPRHMATGFAAYLLLQRAEEVDGEWLGNLGGYKWYLDDPHAKKCAELWQKHGFVNGIKELMELTELWGDLFKNWPAFIMEVEYAAQGIINKGVLAFLAMNNKEDKQMDQ